MDFSKVAADARKEAEAQITQAQAEKRRADDALAASMAAQTKRLEEFARPILEEANIAFRSQDVPCEVRSRVNSSKETELTFQCIGDNAMIPPGQKPSGAKIVVGTKGDGFTIKVELGTASAGDPEGFGGDPKDALDAALQFAVQTYFRAVARVGTAAARA